MQTRGFKLSVATLLITKEVYLCGNFSLNIVGFWGGWWWFFGFFFFLINSKIEINTVLEIITILRYVKAVEGRTIPKTNYFLGIDNGFVRYLGIYNGFVSSSFCNGKGFHGERKKEIAYNFRLSPFSTVLVHTCWHMQGVWLYQYLRVNAHLQAWGNTC